MDAFFDKQFVSVKPKGSYRTKQGWKKDIGYWGVEGSDEFMPVDMPIDGTASSSRAEDPFRGFWSVLREEENGPIPLLPALNHFARSLFLAHLSVVQNTLGLTAQTRKSISRPIPPLYR
jgi:hypothetical protein